MTSEHMKREFMYQASMSPFRKLLENRVISEEDLRVVDTIMCRKYAPSFCGQIAPKLLDKEEKQR